MAGCNIPSCKRVFSSLTLPTTSLHSKPRATKLKKSPQESSQFAIFEDRTTTSEHYTSNKDLLFNSEVQEAQRLMSLYAERFEYDYLCDVLNWSAPYALALDNHPQTQRAPWQKRRLEELQEFHLQVRYEVYEYLRGSSTDYQIQADDEKRMPERIHGRHGLRKWEDNVITEDFVWSVGKIVKEIFIECKYLEERKRQEPRLESGVPEFSCVDCAPIHDLLVFIIPYYTGCGDGLDRKREASYYQRKGDLWARIMKLHLDIDMYDDGRCLLRECGDDELKPWTSYFEASVMRLFKEDKVSVDILRERWSSHHPRMRYHEWQLARPMSCLKNFETWCPA